VSVYPDRFDASPALWSALVSVPPIASTWIRATFLSGCLAHRLHLVVAETRLLSAIRRSMGRQAQKELRRVAGTSEETGTGCGVAV